VIVTASAQLEQVLRNLINNAIKHHDKQNGEVVLSGKRVGDFVEFSVRDNGPGIAPQFHGKIFQLFQTLKRPDEVEGSGMGLAVVKKLVEQQNGRITVHSRGDGTGSEFRFGWPTEATCRIQGERECLTPRSVQLLHVEDDDLCLMGLHRAFRAAKLANPISFAHDGIDALEMLRGTNGRARLPASVCNSSRPQDAAHGRH
jgi:hypothetical protein